MSDTSQRSEVTLDQIVSLCKRRGIIFPGSDIYEGLAGTFDYGPIGAELKRNVKNAWWKSVVYERDDIEGLDAAILMNPRTWKASGHVDTFSDPLCDSLGPSRRRYRADHIEESECSKYIVVDVTDADSPKTIENAEIWAPTKKKAKEFYKAYWEKFLKLEDARVKIEEIEGSMTTGRFSPDDGGLLTEPRAFNLMLTTHCGPVVDSAAKVYLRPETAQGIFVNFANVQTSMRRKLPFGIAQVGKSFRNEITPRNFIFRTREFEQMEIEFFCKPGHLCKDGEMTDDQWHQHWMDARMNWYTRYGIRRDRLRMRMQESDELAHYAKGTGDIEYLFPIGWQELEGIANRTDYDLKQHMEHSGHALLRSGAERALYTIRDRTVRRCGSFLPGLHHGRLYGRTGEERQARRAEASPRACPDQGGGLPAPQEPSGACRDGAEPVSADEEGLPHGLRRYCLDR